MRQNAYQVLDKTIEVALDQRSPDFNGVITCTPQDTLASILAYIRERRCHRFIIVEGDDVPESEGRPSRKKGSLVGILSLSDVLRYLVGHENLKGHEVEGLGASSLLNPIIVALLTREPIGVHGLRGVGKAEGVQPLSSPKRGVDDADPGGADLSSMMSVSEASSASLSRRGSTESSTTGSSLDVPSFTGAANGLALENLTEGKVL